MINGENVIPFLSTFFTNHDCQVTAINEHAVKVQLTEKIDKAIMNRPFYWHYITATGQESQPQTLTLTTKKLENTQPWETIHFGTPRMNDICEYLAASSRFTRVFEQVQVNKQTLLHPWLNLNIIISYKGKQWKEEVISLGLNLINGVIVEDMMESLQTKQFDSFISPNCYTVTPLIKVESGFKRIDKYIDQHLEQQNYTWVKESVLLLKDELLLLAHFYEDTKKQAQLEQEIVELHKRFRPELSVQVINAGIIYLAVHDD